MPRLPARSRRLRGALAATCALPLLTCAVPADDSADIFVTIDAPSKVLARGQAVLLTAHAWRRTSSGREQLPGISFTWTSEDTRTALITAQEEGGTALVTGVGGGRTRILASARAYEEAEAGVLDLRVANTIEIDSVSPDTVRYGEQVTLYGVGFDRIDRATLGETELIVDPRSRAGDPGGAGEVRLWVPYPARSGQVLAVADQGFSAPAPDSTVVLPEDTYDAPGAAMPFVDLNGPAVAGTDTLFHNPALALTGSQTVDGFRFFRADTTRPLSIIVSTRAPAVTFFEPVVYPLLPLLPNPVPDATFGGPFWMLGESWHYCEFNRVPFVKPYGRTAEVRMVRAFMTAPSQTMLLGVYGDPPGGYGVTVVDGYVTADSRIQPDRFEENDTCPTAAARASDPATHIDLATPFADTLTLDNAYELDWIGFTVPESYSGVVTVRVASRPFGAADSSDVGLYVVFADIGSLLAQSHEPGHSETLSFEVPPLRDYYVVVADEAGVATRYALCIAEGSTCSLPQGP